MKRDLCHECDFFDTIRPAAENDGGHFICRKEPPRYSAPPPYNWSQVRADDWCGRWKPNKEIVQAKLRAIDEANAVMGDQ